MKNLIKRLAKKMPFTFTRNQRYDRETILVIKKALNKESNCIDIGCHTGEILDHFIKHAKNGYHYGFEPLPHLFNNLEKNYAHANVVFTNIALSDQTGETEFNHVISNPGYSGMVKRHYDRPNEKDETIKVKMNMLDNIIDLKTKIDFIKIDVEGAELQVLKGARETIKKSKPIIIFEHGLGASEFYNTTPDMVFNFFKELNYNLQTMNGWLNALPAYNVSDFKNQFDNKINYYFLAYPKVLN